jgi:hypothetical protein
LPSGIPFLLAGTKSNVLIITSPLVVARRVTLPKVIVRADYIEKRHGVCLMLVSRLLLVSKKNNAEACELVAGVGTPLGPKRTRV